jgi:hypothetical protein
MMNLEGSVRKVDYAEDTIRHLSVRTEEKYKIRLGTS